MAALLLVLLAPGRAAADAEAQARQALTEGRRADALAHYEAAIRAAEETTTKLRLRDLYRAVEWVEPRPLNGAEKLAVEVHVRNEKLRVYRKAAERFAAADKLHAAIILRRVVMEMVGGPGTEPGKKEAAAMRALVRRLTAPSEEDKAEAEEIVRRKKTGPALLKAARKLLAERRLKVLVRLCQDLAVSLLDQDVKNEALALRQQAEELAATDISAAQKQAALDVITDERFERLDVKRSRHFLFIGPQQFVQAIPAEQKTMLDLAYVFQSDLAGQPLTADGVRITVYYQETFSFGGGLAGGKLIRIGNRAIRMPVAGMLHYHELGHCIFGKGWLHDGFTEGLADFAAGFTLDLLGQTRNAQHFIDRAREQFVRFYLGRDVRYFDIQPYQPSAGFLFSFLPPGEAPFDWAPMRRVYHRMREAQFAAWPSREHELMRYFGYLLATEYGAETLDKLREWGWPVSRADLGRVRREANGLLTDMKRADFLLGRDQYDAAEPLCREVLRAMPDGPLAARARFGLLRIALQRGDVDTARLHKAALGIVESYQVLGPYHAHGQTALIVLPPETRVDLDQPLRFGIDTARWKKAKVTPSGFVDLRKQGSGYPENACAFALTYVHFDAETPARIWLGSDDGHTLYVNNELIEKRATSRTFRFDDDFDDVVFRPGWNRILLKVHNSAGGWGFLLRVVDRHGAPLPGVRFTDEDVEDKVVRFRIPKTKSLPLVNDEFKGLNAARWFQAVGQFDTRNGRLRPLGTEKFGLWYRFKVDPDKPKDGPANIAWLKNPDLARTDSLEMELVVAAQGKDGLPAKFGFTIDGENENDGQSGYSFVIDVHDKKLRCHWYRYDSLLYLQPGVEVPPAELYRFRLTRHGRKWWLLCNDVALFDEVDTPPLPAFGLGLLSWGKGPELESIRVSRLEPR